MADNITKEILEIDARFNAEQLIAGAKKGEKATSKAFGLIKKATLGLKKPFDTIANSYKRIRNESKANIAANERLRASAQKYAAVIERLQKRLQTADREEAQRITAKIKNLQKLKDARDPGGKGGGAKWSDIGAGKAMKGFANATRETISEAAEIFNKLRAKDLPGAFEDGGKLVGKVIEKTFKGSGKFLSNAGKVLSEKGKMAGGVGGGAMKAMGGLMKGIGPLLQMVGKLGPLISSVSTVVVGLVKLFIDAEAQAKEINKEIMESAGSAGFFADNMGDANSAAADLGETLKEIRDSATSLDNLQWGITKETHTAVIKSLEAEGITLSRIKKEFEATSKATKDSAGYVKDWGSMVQLDVAYSRAFGVSLNELTSLQSDLMTEMGMGFADVEKSFSQMTTGAAESGMAANKFFAIIRSASADMNLYNSRMSESVHILTALGKVMSPKNASKFMQTAQGALKGMGRIDRLKLNLLGGGKMAGLVTKDLGRKAGDLAKQISSKGGGQVSTQDILDSSKDTDEILAKVPDELKGTMREAIIEMRTDQKMSGKGVYGAGLAARNLGPGAALQAMKDALMPFGGGAKTLGEARGNLGTEQMAEQLGISEDQLSSMVKFESAMDDQRKMLKKNLRDQKVRDRLDKAGIKLTGDDAKDSQAIDQAGYDDILDTMDEGDKKIFQDSSKQIDYAKQTSEYTQGVLDKLGVIMDFLMNQLYDIFVDIWDSIGDVLGFMNKGVQIDKREVQKYVYKSKDKEMMKLWKESGENAAVFQEKMLSKTFGKDGVQGVIDSSDKAGDATQKALEALQSYQHQMEEGTASGEDLEGLKKAYQDALKNSDKHLELSSAIRQGINDQTAGMNDQKNWQKWAGSKADSSEIIKGIVKSAGLDDFADDISDRVSKGSGLIEAAHEAHLTDDQIDALTKSAMKTMPPAKAVAVMQAYDKVKGAQGGDAAPTAQAQAAAKSDSPGTPAPAAASAVSIPSAASAPSAPAPSMPAASDPVQQIAAKQEDLKDMNADQLAAVTESGSTLNDIFRALRVKGVRMDWKFHKEDYETMVQKGVLDAARIALLEYFLYSKLKDDVVESAIRDGMKPEQLGPAVMDMIQKGTKSGDISEIAKPNAAGGIPMSPAPGEAFASVKPLSEAIVPLDKLGGGGGGLVELRVTGDLARFIDARVVDGNVKFNKDARQR